MGAIFLNLREVFKYYLKATAESLCFVEGEHVLNTEHLILCERRVDDIGDQVNTTYIWIIVSPRTTL